MEIAPIAGIRVTPVLRPQPVDPELTAFFDIEAAAKPSDDTYSAAKRKAAGAEEDEGDDLDLGEAESEDAPASPVAGEEAMSSISYFA
jgi:hypothetical protein